MSKAIIEKFNLYDLLPIENTYKHTKKEDKSDINYIQKLISDAEIMYNIYKENGIKFDNYSEINQKILERINTARKEYFKRNYSLPEELFNSFVRFGSEYTNTQGEYKFCVLRDVDVLSKLSKTPTITLGNMKKLADKLDMIIVPFDYITDDSYRNESYHIVNSIQRFNKSLKDDFDIVVLCPINHYSVMKHANSENPNLDIYSGNHRMVFTSILMNIPLFRSIINELTQIKNDINSINGTVNSIKNNMDMMQIQINNIQKQLNQQKEQMIAQKLQYDEELKSLSKKLSEMTIQVTDPVIFAIPKGIELNSMDIDNKKAIVGPVWGPDFDEIALYELGLSIVQSQRVKLTNTIKNLW